MSTPVNSSAEASDRLRQIESLTDGALARRGATELLDELLERVRDVLSADTAAVLMLDRSAGQLTEIAASGLEDKIPRRLQVPVGVGFAGQVAAEQRPLIVDGLDDAMLVSSALRAVGVTSLLGVPLLAEGRLLGVLQVGTIERRRFANADVDLLQMVADRIAVTVRILVAQDDQMAARALQRSLLPSRLPQVDGLELGARYLPGEGEGIGGDWYDAFELTSGRFGLVIGDVAGHGLAAAVVMGRLRSALRAYALEVDDPAEVMERLDRKVRHFEPGAMATVSYAVFEPSLERVRISLAGHLPPVLAMPGEPVRIADLPVDPPAGVQAPAPRRTSTLPVPPGALLCFYTDGLIERRDRPFDDGLRALCDSVRPDMPETVCTAMMSQLVGRTTTDDDVALVVIRRAS